MTLLSPSLERLGAPLADALQLMENLGCESVHIDACHNMVLPNFFDLEEVRTVQIENYQVAATLHIFQPINGAPPVLGFLRPKNLVVLHVFPQTTQSTIKVFLRTNCVFGFRMGLTVDVRADTESIIPFLAELDTVFVMAIPVATYGLEPDTQLLLRIEKMRTLINTYNPHCRFGIDGGVNSRTFSHMVRLADELVVGGLLFHADNLISQWIELQSIAKGERKR